MLLISCLKYVGKDIDFSLIRYTIRNRCSIRDRYSIENSIKNLKNNIWIKEKRTKLKSIKKIKTLFKNNSSLYQLKCNYCNDEIFLYIK